MWHVPPADELKLDFTGTYKSEDMRLTGSTPLGAGGAEVLQGIPSTVQFIRNVL